MAGSLRGEGRRGKLASGLRGKGRRAAANLRWKGRLAAVLEGEGEKIVEIEKERETSCWDSAHTKIGRRRKG